MPDLNLFGALLVIVILVLSFHGGSMLALYLTDRKTKQERRRQMEALIAERERKRRVMESYWQYPEHRESDREQ